MAKLGLKSQTYSLTGAIMGAAHGERTQAPLEFARSDELREKLHATPLTRHEILIPTVELARAVQHQRDLTVATAAAGGYLVETENLDFMELLRQRSAAARAGVQFLPDLRGNVTIPKMVSGATYYWLPTEATAITESQPTFGAVAMTPKNIGAYVEVSRQLVIQSNPSAERIVANELVAGIAAGVDRAIFQGTGASGQPTGLVNLGTINTFTGAGLNYAAVLDAAKDVVGGDTLVNPATCAYVTTVDVAVLLKTRARFTDTDSPIWRGSLLQGEIEGFPAFSSVNMPAGTMIFGDFSSVIVGEWGGGIRVEVNPYANFPAGIIGFRVFYSCDVAVRSGLLFSIATGIS